MKIKLLIASGDSDYVDHFSNVLAEKYDDTFEVSVCSSTERFKDLLEVRKFDIILMEQSYVPVVNLSASCMHLIFWDESEHFQDNYSDLKKVCKYQRISSIVGNILENYSEIDMSKGSFSTDKAHITVVWSPCGGVGKTTVSLAFAARKVSMGKQTTYLNLENFSSVSTYFAQNGKSISSAFEKLDSNLNMFLKGIRQQDSGSGINYFCSPSNYDDINILTTDNIETLINACACETDELVIDLSSQCDERTQKVFDIADMVLLVCDSSSNSQAKLRQFINQHNISQIIQSKSVLINNRGANISETSISRRTNLPVVQSFDAISVYKTLSSNSFEW